MVWAAARRSGPRPEAGAAAAAATSDCIPPRQRVGRERRKIEYAGQRGRIRKGCAWLWQRRQ